MKLYRETLGTGPQLVLLHGWGLHTGIWTPLLDALAPRYTLTLIDLPGHGRSRGITMQDAANTVRQLLEIAPPRANWLGWSLGGMLALKLAATAPERVESLLMIAALPSFVARCDWPFGMNGEVLAGFAEQLATDFDATLLRFLSLQMRGVSNSKALLRDMRTELARYGKPDASALRAGLAILQNEDLRPSLATLQMPARLILGERDTLVATQAGRQLAEATGIGMDVIAGAGHVPFLSHPQAFNVAVNSFLPGQSA